MPSIIRVAVAVALTPFVGVVAAAAQPASDQARSEAEVDAEGVAESQAETPAEVTVEVREVASETPKDKPASVGYDKGFFVKSGDGKYSLKFTGRVQPFYAGTMTGARSTNKNAFEVRRARLTIEGNVHSKDLLYKMQTDFGKGLVTLKDFHFDVKLAKSAWLRVGQWKKPFSRQLITSSGKLELTDRAITDKAFGAGRDIGVAIRNDYEKSPELEWIIGAFNGSGDAPKLAGTIDPVKGTITSGTFSNVPTRFKPVVVARVGFNSKGTKGYTEADLEGGDLRWGAAASVAVEGDYDSDNKSNQKAEVDFVVKKQGLSATGGFYGMSSQTESQVFSSQELSHVGLHLQAGYLATSRIQGVARFAIVDVRPDFEGSQKDLQELAIGANYYGFGHDAKLQAGARFLKSGDASFTDDVLFEIGANVGW